LLGTAAASLLAWGLAPAFRRRPTAAAAAPRQAVVDALRTGRFWRIALSFGVCGFHIGFLAMHMPGVIERCALPASLAGTWVAVCGAANIAGSLAIGAAMKHGDAARLLGGLYLVRALGIVALLLLPATPAVLLGFAALMGASFMATLPPTSQLIARAHGVQRLGTLFGFVMLVHQVGSFFGIWFGGWAAQATGSDHLLWIVDIVLAIAAAALVLPESRRATNGAPRAPAALPTRA
jgi:predicted MFS family arabinose efflux permease